MKRKGWGDGNAGKTACPCQIAAIAVEVYYVSPLSTHESARICTPFLYLGAIPYHEGIIAKEMKGLLEKWKQECDMVHRLIQSITGRGECEVATIIYYQNITFFFSTISPT